MKKDFLNLRINRIHFDCLIEEILDNAKTNISSYLCAVNVHMTVEAQTDEVLKSAVNSATWAVTDGMPVAWTYSKLLKTAQERIAGMDITPELLHQADKHGLVVSVYGNTKKNLDKFRMFVSKHFPNVIIGCLISPPFRTLSETELKHNIHLINIANSQIVFVSLGCPKQEIWMLKNSLKIKGVCLGIGNAINTTIGEEKRPPKLVQKIGMEWLFRLFQNPKRLFKRYLYTNIRFCIMIFKKALKLQ